MSHPTENKTETLNISLQNDPRGVPRSLLWVCSLGFMAFAIVNDSADPSRASGTCTVSSSSERIKRAQEPAGSGTSWGRAGQVTEDEGVFSNIE